VHSAAVAEQARGDRIPAQRKSAGDCCLDLVEHLPQEDCTRYQLHPGRWR
jgi:hypothetical protein